MAAFRAEWATPEYWLAFAPSLHVASGTILRRGLVPFCTDEAPAALRAALAADGFFQLAPPEDCGLFDDGGGWGVDVAALGDAVVALGEAGWPPIYVLVYDEAWVLRGRLAHTLRGAADLAVNFDFAAFHVRAGGNAQTLAAGWAPHRDRDDAAHVGGAVADGFDADGAPKCATAWVALSDATPATSCLYCVPRARDPGYAAGDGGRSPLEGCFAAGPASFRHVRALPAPMGGVLAFSHRLLHWGSAPDAGAPPRVAVAFGAGSESSPLAASAAAAGRPFRDAPGLLAAGCGVAPPFGERVALAAAQLLVYARSADAGIAADRRRHWACFARSADAFDAMYARHCRAEFDLLGGGG